MRTLKGWIAYFGRARDDVHVSMSAGEWRFLFKEIEERLNALEFEQRTRAWGLDPKRSGQ